MATQVPAATISLPSGFEIHSQDGRLKHKPQPRQPVTSTPDPPLGVLSNFTGTFAGTGFNLIFRPNSGPPNGTTFPNPVNPPPPTPPSENVLELNLTTETLSFSKSLGSVPNRGLEGQGDIFLNGVPYVQAISDVTNLESGKADGVPSGIHFEPGLWYVFLELIHPHLNLTWNLETCRLERKLSLQTCFKAPYILSNKQY